MNTLKVYFFRFRPFTIIRKWIKTTFNLNIIITHMHDHPFSRCVPIKWIVKCLESLLFQSYLLR